MFHHGLFFNVCLTNTLLLPLSTNALKDSNDCSLMRPKLAATRVPASATKSSVVRSTLLLILTDDCLDPVSGFCRSGSISLMGRLTRTLELARFCLSSDCMTFFSLSFSSSVWWSRMTLMVLMLMSPSLGWYRYLSDCYYCSVGIVATGVFFLTISWFISRPNIDAAFNFLDFSVSP